MPEPPPCPVLVVVVVHLLSLPLLPELPEHAPEVVLPSCVQVDVVDLAASALVANGATATAITTLVTAIANAIFAVLVSNMVQRVKILTYLTNVVQRRGV